jgi:hypothetical protein
MPSLNPTIDPIIIGGDGGEEARMSESEHFEFTCNWEAESEGYRTISIAEVPTKPIAVFKANGSIFIHGRPIEEVPREEIIDVLRQAFCRKRGWW